MARITFPDGRWVELRPMYVADELAFEEMASAGSDAEAAGAHIEELAGRASPDLTEDEQKALLDEAVSSFEVVQRIYFERLRFTVGRMEAACTATSWAGNLSDRVTRDELYGLVRQWRVASEDDALPPVNEPSSATP